MSTSVTLADTQIEHLEMFSLVWLDPDSHDHRHTERKLRSIINKLKKFQDLDQYEAFIQTTSVKDRLIFIVSGQIGREILPKIHHLRQVVSIYIYCMDKTDNEQWSSAYAKVKRVITDLDELVLIITQDHRIEMKIEEPLSINIFSVSAGGKSTVGLNGKFVFSQVLIDCLLRLKSIDQDKTELIQLLKQQYDGNQEELDSLNEFETTYRSTNVLYWYTKECFFYKTLNSILRTENIHFMFLYRSFILDIQQQLQVNQSNKILQVYRAQIISKDELENLKKSIDQFISINSFFSTTEKYSRALSFFNNSISTDTTEKILFQIHADPAVVKTKPFANISRLSEYPNEEEVLFMIGSIFRLKKISYDEKNQFSIVEMVLSSDDDNQLKQVLTNMKQQTGDGETNLRILAAILWEMGQLDLAERYFERFLEQIALDDPQRGGLYEDLAKIASQSGEFDKSMKWRQKSIEFKQNNPDALYFSSLQLNSNIASPNTIYSYHSKWIDATDDEITTQMTNLMNRMNKSSEYTIPRYFFILPAKDYDFSILETDTNLFHLHFKLYFLCECSTNPKELHITQHDGYSIKKFKELIVKSGLYLQITLNLVKILVSIGRSSLSQQVAHKIDFARKFLDKPEIKLIYGNLSSTRRNHSIQTLNLQEIEEYFDRTDSTTQLLGNLHRIITEDGQIHWICQKDYDTISYNQKVSGFLKPIEDLGGKFSEENKQMYFNQLKLPNSIGDILIKGAIISELIIDNCSIYEGYFDVLLNIILNRSSIYYFQIQNLKIQNYFRISKYVVALMKMSLSNYLLNIQFTIDQNPPATLEIIEKIFIQNKIYRTLAIRASDFLQHERHFQRILDSSVSFTDLIVENANNTNSLHLICNLKLNRLKLTDSLLMPSIENEFCQLVKTNQTLVELDLMDSNDISNEEFLHCLFQTVKQHQSIKQIRLHISSIETFDVKESALIDILKNYKFISHLRLSNSIISSRLVEAIVDAIEQYHSLIYLEFYLCHMNENHLEQFKILEATGVLFHFLISQQQYQTNNLAHRTFSQFQLTLTANLSWRRRGRTIAGGNGYGSGLNQLHSPQGICIDNRERCIYIADYGNHRIMKWKFGEICGEVVAGGNGSGDRIDQLSHPSDVIVDQRSRSLVICDFGNKRLVQWPLEDPRNVKILIRNIKCVGVKINEQGDLFVSDFAKHHVRKWKRGELGAGTFVAGGNGRGKQLNQLHNPSNIFVDRNDTVYVSDYENHRVMKWLKGAKEGIVVAGGHGQGMGLKQLDLPCGLIVNEIGDVFVADCNNNRIMCWPLGSKEGRVVINGSYSTEEYGLFNCPRGLAFDSENNLYVVELSNKQVIRFDVN